MSRFYVQFNSAGKGRATGWVADEDWAAHVAAHPDFGHLGLGLKQFRALAGLAHQYRFDLEKGVVPKTEIVMTADKVKFAGDGKDRATVTWQISRPVECRINGTLLSSNPHEGGLILSWDQAQRLRLEIDDYEFHGFIDLEAT